MELEGTALSRAESVMKSARRAADLTRQLLAFSRRQIVQPRILSMNPIVSDTAKMAEHILGEDIDFTTSLCPEPWLVHVDRSQVEQVVMNLMVNARDAMPGGGKLTIETTNVEVSHEHSALYPAVPPGRYFMLSITDTGVGMSEETKARLFEPFYTTKGPGKGTGLGLPMVYGIVNQNHGVITYDSTLGEGTCFKIYLPATLASETVDDVPEPAPAPVAKRRATILLVEDEAPLSELMMEFLSSDGYEVFTANSQAEAFEQATARDGEIDLLLADLRGANGRELIARLRESGYTMRVIFISGHSADAMARQGMVENGVLLLQKPFDRAALIAKVQEALMSS
jgi:CheY-like chemotaxis protein